MQYNIISTFQIRGNGLSAIIFTQNFCFSEVNADVSRECLDNLFRAITASETKNTEFAITQSTHVDLFKNHII